MGDVDQNQTEETQTEVDPTQAQPEPEAEAEEPAPEEAEAKGDAPEGEEPAEDEKPEEPGQKPEEGGKHKRAGGWQRRLDRLERQLQQRDEIIQQLVSQRPGQSAPQPQEKTEAEKQAEYIDSLVARRLQEERVREQQTRVQVEFQQRIEKTKAQHPDFDDVVLNADAPVSQAVAEALLTSDHGPAIMYQLAKSPAELARISALPPLVAAREIGRLEAKLASVTAAPPKPKAAIRPPAPPTTVGGASKSTRSLEDLPIAEYKRAVRSRHAK